MANSQELTAAVELRLDALAEAFQEMRWKRESEEDETMTDQVEKLQARVRELETYLGDHAYSLAGFAHQVREEYVRISETDGEVPTNAQGVALARFLRPQFQNSVHPGERRAQVSRGGAGLGDNYLYVALSDGYEGGIDRDGRTST